MQNVEHLINWNFALVGEWRTPEWAAEDLSPGIQGKAGVFAFVVDGQVCYIGSSRRLDEALGRYPRRAFGPSTATPLRKVHKGVRETFAAGRVVGIYAFTIGSGNDLDEVEFAHQLIDELSPPWNNLRSAKRLPASELRKALSHHIEGAVEKLLRGFADHPFGESTDYDLLTTSGRRLSPKAVFGLALSDALGSHVGPRHFTGGVGTICFQLLVEAGYEIVPKGKTLDVELPPLDDEREWAEGNLKLLVHLRRERARGLAREKKKLFKMQHGKLFCEKCGFDPAPMYGAPYGDSCIEVHHAKIAVEAMEPGHGTKLEDLQCLCANCHRVVHRRMKDEAKTEAPRQQSS
jgi:hypothetical protein